MAAAVESSLSPSHTNLMSHFSPYTDSPSSPAPFNNNKRSSTYALRKALTAKELTSYRDSTGHLLPNPQKSPGFSSPSDIADPSPIASSNGTDFDETATDSAREPSNGENGLPPIHRASITVGSSLRCMRRMLIAQVQTTDADGNTFKPNSDDEDPSSVIHAPGHFQSFVSVD